MDISNNLEKEQDYSVKEEPKDENEYLAGANNLIPSYDVKLENDNFNDKPEYINLENSCENSFYDNSSDNLYENTKTAIVECGEILNKTETNQSIENKHNEENENTDDYENTSVTDISHSVPSIILNESDVNDQDYHEKSNMELGGSDNYSSDEDDYEFTCKVCKQKFIDEFELQLHFKSRRLAEKSYKCCGCEKTFRDNTQLNVHSRKHTGEQPYACKVCGKKFSVNGNLSKHMRIHTGERKYECDTCERKFTQFAHLEDHMKTHSGDRPYVCDFCNSAFKTKARLRKHRKSHEDDRITKRSVKCPVCSKILKSTKQLLSHMETHDTDNINPFPCKICGKSYKHLFTLNFHMKIHGGIKEFKCNLCDKAFCNSSHLRRHALSHTGVRPFSCELCMRGFPSAQNLKRHMMTHTGEKPFVCDVCDKGFLTLENLNRHKRTHTGEKPFPCDICGKFFAHSTTAKEHQRIHTGDKPFGCTICDKKFSLNKALYKHIRERHPKYFPEFKRINDLPPNMKRAREKMKREAIEFEETDVKCGNITVLPLVNQCGASSTDSVTVPKLESTDSEGPAQEIPFIKVEKQEFDYS